MTMATLEAQLQRISERIAHFGEHPSSMTRDILLGELRQCYELVLQMELTTERDAASEVVQPSEMTHREENSVVDKTEAPEKTASVAEEMIVETPVTRDDIDVSATAESTESASISVAAKAEKTNDGAILAGKLNRKPIADLQSGIPLNEKFGIIRNLFGGNASDFGDAVLKMNHLATPEELKQYFLVLAQRRDWDTESESYHLFLSYVDRKAAGLSRVGD